MTEENQEFTVAYLDSCDRLPLVLIHGFPLHSAMWQLQIEDLGDLARVIAPDLRGHGRSGATPPPYTMAMLADDCADLLDYLAIPGPIILGGLSMGGYVALEFYRRYPERVGALVLAATRAGADSPAARHGRDELALLAQQQGHSAVTEKMLPSMLAPATFEEKPEVVDLVQDMIGDAAIEGMVGALQAMKDRPDYTPSLADIDIPVLIIHGADDRLIPVAEAEGMQSAMPDSRLVIIPGAGHLPNLERSDEFSDAIADFIEYLTT